MIVFSQREYLTLLTHAPAQAVKDLAEDVLTHIDAITVLENRTGLVMLPYTDSAGGAVFHLGEVLVSEARVQIAESAQGYGAVLGRDLVQAVAVAVIDASIAAGIAHDVIAPFLDAQGDAQRADDDALLRQVEQTRIEMETF